MPIKNNNDLRIEARKNNVALWQVAQELNIAETTLLRWLRYDLEPSKRARILEAIENVAAQLYGERSKTQ